MSSTIGKKNSMFAARNLILSILGLLGLIALVGLFLLSGVINLIDGGRQATGIQETYNLIWVFGFFTLLTVPLLIIAIYQLMGKPQPGWLQFPTLSRLQVFIILGIWLALLGISFPLAKLESVYWLIAPPIKIFAVVLPLAVIVLLLGARFRRPEPSRNWGLISFSLLITEPLTIFLEIILILVFVVVLGLSADWSGALGNDGYIFLNRLMYGFNNPDILSRILMPFLQQPLILVIIFLLFSVLIPMLEEIMKPLALWFLAKKEMLPDEGFYFGAVTGMVFALIESIIGLANFGADTWISVAVMRVGTGILHTFTAAMLGWALSLSWKRYKFGRLVLTFFVCVAVHGTWNFLAIGTSINDLLPLTINPAQGVLQIVLPALLVLMALGMLAVLFIFSKRLEDRKKEHLITAQPPALQA